MVKLPLDYDTFEVLSFDDLVGAPTVPIGFLDQLTRATTRQGILDVYSAWCHKIFGADRCSVLLLNDNQELCVDAAHGEKASGPKESFELSGTIAEYVIKSQSAVFIPDLSVTTSRGCVLLHEHGYKNTAMGPIVIDDQYFGIIALSYVEPTHKDNPDLKALEPIGRSLATQLFLIDKLTALSDIATKDALTDAYNRHFFNTNAKSHWDYWEECGQPFVFISIDIDHFKSINDTYGHEAGDTVLKEIVRRLNKLTRRHDQIIRMGGEEFGIFAVDIGLDSAIELSKRLASEIHDVPFEIDGVQIPVSISIGLAEPQGEDMGIEDVLRRADKALYEAKHLGRKRVIASTQQSFVEIVAFGH